MKRSEGSIYVYCDGRSGRHPAGRENVAITNYYRSASQGWSEQFRKRGGKSVNVTLQDDHPIGVRPYPGDGHTYRRKDDLRCRYCGDRGSVSLKAEILDAALSECERAGVSEVSLSALAAIVTSISQR